MKVKTSIEPSIVLVGTEREMSQIDRMNGYVVDKNLHVIIVGAGE